MKKIVLLFVIILLLGGCRRAAAPQATETAVPASAEEPTAEATETAAPAPTETTAPAATPTEAAPEPTETAVPAPTATETPAATATSAPAALAITAPVADSTVDVGSTVTVAGEAPAGAGAVSVSLEAAGRSLVSGEAQPQAETGAWQLSLAVPGNVVGPADLRATLPDGTEVSQTVLLVRPTATSGPAISLAHPTRQSMAVAGHALFFTGRVQRAVEGMVTIELRYEDCQTVAAQQSFDVGEGGSWWGFLVVPETVFGPACALAYFGDPTTEEEPGQLAQTSLAILEEDDPAAQGLFIGNFPNSELVPGAAVAVYGSAFNVPNRQVGVQIEVDGTIVAEGTATADSFGYWEVELTLPATVSTAATGQFVATATYGDEEIVDIVPFEVVAGN